MGFAKQGQGQGGKLANSGLLASARICCRSASLSLLLGSGRSAVVRPSAGTTSPSQTQRWNVRRLKPNSPQAFANRQPNRCASLINDTHNRRSGTLINRPLCLPRSPGLFFSRSATQPLPPKLSLYAAIPSQAAEFASYRLSIDGVARAPVPSRSH